MTDLEYTLCCERPFGLYRVHALCTNIATQVYQCIKQLEKLDDSRSKQLVERFFALQNLVQQDVYKEVTPLSGPGVIPLGEECLHEDVAGIVDPATIRLEKLRSLCPEAVPSGFVVTAVGCQQFFQTGDLPREFARQVQACGGYATANLQDLSRSLMALILLTPLPETLVEGVLAEVRRLRNMFSSTNVRLLFRGRLWPFETRQNSFGIEDPGLLLWGPSVDLHASDSEILQALHATFAKKRSAQALIYRRARGLTDHDVGMSITCMLVGENAFGGLVHTASPLAPEDKAMYLYACSGLPQDMEYSALPVEEFRLTYNASTQGWESTDISQSGVERETLQKVAELAAKFEAHEKKPLSLSWIAGSGGRIQCLLVRPMILAQRQTFPTPETTDSKTLVSGGACVSPGRICAPAFVVKTWEDTHDFPKGSILVIPDDSYLWASLIDNAVGLISCKGYVASRLGSLAREFGRPALFGVPNALEHLQSGQKITLCADIAQVFEGECADLLDTSGKARDFMPGSPVFSMLQKAGEHILPLTLDVDSLDFRADNCQTYHDIARYCHEMAVSAMFSIGSDKHNAPTRVRQLRDKILKQFWIINLSDGFASIPAGPAIDIEKITSLPMLALWHGMTVRPWEGPPPVDGKGFMSVLFEATANPHLDPASQSNFFSEKNYFLISREYCSLHSRFGFHFVSVEGRLGERQKDNYLQFQLRGGGANIERRILRVRFVADLLWEFGFSPQIQNDAVSARLEGFDIEEGKHLFAVAGYMTIHTRQLDMIMQDSVQVAEKYKEMLSHCRALYTGRPNIQEGMKP